MMTYNAPGTPRNAPKYALVAVPSCRCTVTSRRVEVLATCCAMRWRGAGVLQGFAKLRMVRWAVRHLHYTQTASSVPVVHIWITLLFYFKIWYFRPVSPCTCAKCGTLCSTAWSCTYSTILDSWVLRKWNSTCRLKTALTWFLNVSKRVRLLPWYSV